MDNVEALIILGFACGLALGATLALAIQAWVVDVREYRSRDEH